MIACALMNSSSSGSSMPSAAAASSVRRLFFPANPTNLNSTANTQSREGPRLAVNRFRGDRAALMFSELACQWCFSGPEEDVRHAQRTDRERLPEGARRPGDRSTAVLAAKPSRRPANQAAIGSRLGSEVSTSLLASARANVAAEGFKLSTMELGIRIVAPRSFVVS